MDKKRVIKLAIILVAAIAIEGLSFWGSKQPIVNSLIFGLATASVLALSIYRLEYGLLAIIAELLIGSLGHLFFISWSGHEIALRISLWLVVMIVFGTKFIIQLIKSKGQSEYWQRIKDFSWKKHYLLIGLFIIIGLVNGWLRHHDPAIMLVDFNSWLYFLLLFPLLAVYHLPLEEKKRKRLADIFWAGAIFLSLKTLFLLYIFTHGSAFSPDIYLWLRHNLLGEMTPTKTGWPRIFMQSQIFSSIALLAIFWLSQAEFAWRRLFANHNWLMLLMAGFFISTIILSFSRSFWLGLLIAIAVSLVLVWRQSGWKKMVRSISWLFAAGLLSLLVIYLVSAFPYWKQNSSNLGETILARVSDSGEAAVASRWSLLPVLIEEIKKAPLIGQGYGATVTYYSQDPRVLQSDPSGRYTTYIFEWSYLDTWLKLGALGLVAYLLLIFWLIWAAIKAGLKKKDYLMFALGTSLIFLAVTNIFTPYFNHPLGIGFLLVASCLIVPNRVY